MKNGNKQHAQREDLKKALSNMYPLVESGALIHDTGRQAGLLRLGFTKAIPSLTKAAWHSKQESGEEQDACAHVEESLSFFLSLWIILFAVQHW